MDTTHRFASRRERRLWGWALAVVAAIYATLGVTPSLAGFLRDRGLLGDAFWLGLLLIAAAVVVQGLRRRPGGLEVGVALGVAGAYLIAFLRTAIPEERSHLIEYGVVALLLDAALTERRRHGRRVPVPALLAIGATVLVGTLDEGIQYLLPGRTFDLFDIGFDAAAAVMAVGGSRLLAWARRAGARRAAPTVHPWTPADRAACLALFDANTPAFFAERERADYTRFLDENPPGYRVCRRAGRVVAAFGLSPSGPDGRARLQWILTADRGAGLGRFMMTHVLAEARTAGVRVLDIAASQHSAPFFARFGAVARGHRPDAWGPGLDRVDMELPVAGDGPR